jgi:hypothetical protein
MPVPPLPNHLSQYTRRASKVNIDDLLTSIQTDPSTLHSLIHQNYPPSCFTPDDIDAISTTLSDSDFLLPTFSNPSSTQEKWATYATISGVLLGLPSPVAKRTEHMMRWAESSRLPRKIRDQRERFERVRIGIGDIGMSAGKREDLLLDVFPLAGRIGHKGRKKDLEILCGFPLRGRTVELLEEEDVEVVEVKKHTGGWLEDDDIED